MVDIQQQVLGSSETVALQQCVESLREELDDHRESINENTTELNTVYELLNELDGRLARVQSMVEELCLVVKGPSSLSIAPLSSRERAVCRALYALGQTRPWVSYDELAKSSFVGKDVLAVTVAGLLSKGVPVLKKYDGNRAYVQLRQDFRQLQAKNNIIRVDVPLSCWIQD